MSYFLANKAVGLHMRWSDWKFRAPLLRATRQVERVQHELLLSILRENANTAFGRDHDFASIANMAGYRAQVPVRTYDQIEPYIVRQQNGEKALTALPPVYYARTSGTTGRIKDIPLTASGLKQIKQAQKQLAVSLWRDTAFFKGVILGCASPVEEGRLANGMAYGSTSGSTYKSLSPVLKRKFIIPYSVFSIKDMETKYQCYALAVLASDEVTGIAAANPSSILQLINIIENDAPLLLNALISGATGQLHPDITAMLPLIARHARPDRLEYLRRKINTQGRLTPDDIWPRLSAIATWTGGSCGIAIARLRLQLPRDVKIVEYGYAASEFIGAVNMDARANRCLPLLTDHVYEFVPRADWEAGRHNFLGLHEIDPGKDYYIFITTRSGLYRYDINDIVRAEPSIGQCAALRFLQKGRGVTNITGEKLSEDQLVAAVTDVLDANKLSAISFLALADEDASQYALLLECPEAGDCKTLAKQIDQRLRAGNSEYDNKRASGRLQPLRIELMQQGAGAIIKRWNVERGVREAQYKPTVLDYSRNWMDKLAPLVERCGA